MFLLTRRQVPQDDRRQTERIGPASGATPCVAHAAAASPTLNLLVRGRRAVRADRGSELWMDM